MLWHRGWVWVQQALASAGSQHHACNSHAMDALCTQHLAMASPAAKRAAGLNLRYTLTKLWHAWSECTEVVKLVANQHAASPTAVSSGKSLLQLLSQRWHEAYNQRLTMAMYMAGAAMAPGLNKAALEDRDALEKLVVRKIFRPQREVYVGDVVAFNNPLHPDSTSNVMVRRVAALEGHELIRNTSSHDSTATQDTQPAGSDDEGEELLTVPLNTCWVLADNEDLNPPQVIDSRTFGFLPLANIIGRVVYAENSGAVQNSEFATDQDRAVIEAEVAPELEQLFGKAGEASQDQS